LKFPRGYQMGTHILFKPFYFSCVTTIEIFMICGSILNRENIVFFFKRRIRMIKNLALFVNKTSVIEMNSILRSAILFNSSI
jgi:hypothetical protein